MLLRPQAQHENVQTWKQDEEMEDTSFVTDLLRNRAQVSLPGCCFSIQLSAWRLRARVWKVLQPQFALLDVFNRQ